MALYRPGSLRTRPQSQRHHRAWRLRAALLYSALGAWPLAAQPAPQPPQPAAPKPASPFEAVVEAPQPAPPAALTDTIELIEFRGARRVPQDTLRAMIFTKRGDIYNEEALHRDLVTLWNTQRFDDIRLERERGDAGGWLVRFVVVERPVVRTLNFVGNKSVTTSEILERFRDRRVGLSVESQFDANRLQRARLVLQDYLAERGRQFATVTPEIEQLPPNSLAITLRVDEGPKVKVGQINIEGNRIYSDLVVRRAMKVLRPIGIPRSIFLENLFAKTYDSTKLEVDAQLITQFYQKNGYFNARVVEQNAQVIDYGGGRFRLPVIYANRPGKRAIISLNIEEGRRYRLNNVNYVGMKLFRAPDALTRPIFGMGQGDVFSTEKLQKGLDELRKLYGNYGYMNFFATPEFDTPGNTDLINMTLNIDEGPPFFIRRIDFSGNTTTRDKVIRRELLVDEGDPYSRQLWDMSILRLNQLGYFQTLKADESVDVRTDTRTNTVDLTLRVQEQGKNTVQMSGGVSGISGSFLGFAYSTNNFLGLGESLSLSSNVGTRYKEVSFGFTEPYFLDKPIQLGFTATISRFSFNQAREASVLAGANLIPLFNSIGTQNLLNYNSVSRGFTVFASYPLRRSFARVGISFGYSIQNVETLTSSATQYYNYLNFLNINGPNQLEGIRTLSVTPTYSYNSTDSPMIPTRGTRFQASLQFAGGILGGNVNQVLPVIDWAHFRAGLKPSHVIGMHVLARYVTGFGGKVAPPFTRFFMGGENDVRGFPLYGVSPVAFVPTEALINLLNNDGSPRQQMGILADGTPGLVNSTQQIPTYQMVFPGGDTNIIANFEYRIPIFGPVTLAAFFDAGVNRLSNLSQLKLNPGRITDLNNLFPEAAFKDAAVVAKGTQLIRTSTGLELQVLMPVFNQPFRIYWAYNPTRVAQFVQPPIVADRSYFPNNASFFNSLLTFGQAIPYVERKSVFRFTIGRTF
jgi:outer membrane protein insertion porin family